jgi:hypothetical protein
MPFTLINQNCPELKEEIIKKWKEEYTWEYNKVPSWLPYQFKDQV